MTAARPFGALLARRRRRADPYHIFPNFKFELRNLAPADIGKAIAQASGQGETEMKNLLNKNIASKLVKSQEGAMGYILAWMLGIPASVLLVIFLIRGQ